MPAIPQTDVTFSFAPLTRGSGTCSCKSMGGYISTTTPHRCAKERTDSPSRGEFKKDQQPNLLAMTTECAHG